MDFFEQLSAYLQEEGLTYEEFFYTLDFLVAVVIILIAAVVLVFLRISVWKHRPRFSKEDVDYRREVPENWTPAEMCPLFYHYSRTIYIDESISATILDLARRGFLEINSENKKNPLMRLTDKKRFETYLVNDGEGNEAQRIIPYVKPHELKLIDILDDVVPAGEWFSIKDFERYCQQSQNVASHKIEEFRKLAEEKCNAMGLFGNKKKKLSEIVGALISLAGLAVVTLLSEFTLWSGLALIVLGMSFYFGGRERRPLTEDGLKWYKYFHGMKEFFEDFTLLDERELPDMVVWEEYLVYATAMGVADKVADQLEMKYPATTAKGREMKLAFSNLDPIDVVIMLKLSKPIARMASAVVINTAGNFAKRFSASGLTKVFGNGGANISKTINVIGKMVRRK